MSELYWSECLATNRSCMEARAAPRKDDFAYPLLLLPKEHRQKCVNLANYTTVFDFSCSFPHGHTKQPFHRIMNCLLPLAPLSAHAEKMRARAAFLVPEYLADFLGLLFRFPRDQTFLFYKPYKGDSRACYNIASESLIFNEMESKQGAVYNSVRQKHFLLTSKEILLNRVQQSIDAMPTHKPAFRRKRVLVITRNKSRSFCDFYGQTLPKIIQMYRDYTVDLYFGNESTSETIRRFGQADVVLGYHGAGLANVIFRFVPAMDIAVRMGLLTGARYPCCPAASRT